MKLHSINSCFQISSDYEPQEIDQSSPDPTATDKNQNTDKSYFTTESSSSLPPQSPSCLTTEPSLDCSGSANHDASLESSFDTSSTSSTDLLLDYISTSDTQINHSSTIAPSKVSIINYF